MTHYFSEKQESRPRYRKIRFKVKGRGFEFYSASGVFSKYKLDFGTRLLIENALIKKNSKILDLGCGNGVIGIVMAKIYSTGSVLVDVNERALKLCEMNAKLNDADVRIVKSNLYEKIKGKFDSIVSNPPITAGRQVCFNLITGAKEHLKKNGKLQIVARRRKGGQVLSEKMNETFGNVSVVKRKAGYYVYCSELL